MTALTTPLPSVQDSEQCDRAVTMFHFLGILLAKVLQDSRLVDLPLSRPFLKLMSSVNLAQEHNRSATVGAGVTRRREHERNEVFCGCLMKENVVVL